MKKATFRLASLLLCLSLLLGLLTLSVGATKPKESHTPIRWSISADLTDLMGNGKHYERYYANGAFYGDARRSFCFMNQVVYDGKYCTVYGDALDPHIVSVRTSPGYSTIFVDAEGKAILDAFLDGSDAIYYLESIGDGSYSTYTVLDQGTVDALDAAYTAPSSMLIPFAVTRLNDATIYEVTAHDRTETKAYQHGAVYQFADGSFYYVCFRGLDNSHFDADGYFSYRSGTVDAYPLDGALLSTVNDAIEDLALLEREYLYESGVVNGHYDENGNPIDRQNDANTDGVSIFLFYATIVLFGVLIPIGALLVGIVLARPKKTGRAVHWYGLVAASGLLLLSSVLLLLIASI